MKLAVDFIRHLFQYIAQPNEVEAFQKFLGLSEKILPWEGLFQLLHVQGLAPFTYYSLRAPEWQCRLSETFLTQLNTFPGNQPSKFFPATGIETAQ